MRHPDVEVRIESLVLAGFLPKDVHRIREALEEEMTRLFAEEATPGSALRGHTQQLEHGPIHVAASQAAEVGRQAAHAIYRGLSQRLDIQASIPAIQRSGEGG